MFSVCSWLFITSRLSTCPFFFETLWMRKVLWLKGVFSLNNEILNFFFNKYSGSFTLTLACAGAHRIIQQASNRLDNSPNFDIIQIPFVSIAWKDHILRLKFQGLFGSFWCFLGRSKNAGVATYLLSSMAMDKHVLCILTSCEVSGRVHFKIMVMAWAPNYLILLNTKYSQ